MKILVITPIQHIQGAVELLKSKGEVYLAENSTKEEVKLLIHSLGIEAILCNPNKQGYLIDEFLLESSSISIINSCSTGTNHIDLEYCKRNNIEVLCLKKDYELINKLPSTSELALTLTLALLRKLIPSIEHTKKFKWDYEPFIGRMCSELTIGIVGYGRLGKIMAKICKPLFKKILIYDPHIEAEEFSNSSSLEELFRTSDVISLHVHVEEQTKDLIDFNIIKCSQKSPILVNTSRGEIVNEKDVIRALKLGLISGYGTDVVTDEFGDLYDSPILKEQKNGLNIIVTPHTGGMTKEGQTLAYNYAINKF